MEHLSKIILRRICKILIKQNDEEEKKLKKYKRVNGNIKKLNKIAQIKMDYILRLKVDNQFYNDYIDRFGKESFFVYVLQIA